MLSSSRKGHSTGARVVTRAFAMMQAACPLRRCAQLGADSRPYPAFRGAREIIEAGCQPVGLPFAREIGRFGPSRGLVAYGGERRRGVHGRNPAVELQVIRLSCTAPSPERV